MARGIRKTSGGMGKMDASRNETKTNPNNPRDEKWKTRSSKILIDSKESIISTIKLLSRSKN